MKSRKAAVQTANDNGSVHNKMARILVAQYRETGACTMLDLRRAGFSRAEVIEHIDGARIIARQALPGHLAA